MKVGYFEIIFSKKSHSDDLANKRLQKTFDTFLYDSASRKYIINTTKSDKGLFNENFSFTL